MILLLMAFAMVLFSVGSVSAATHILTESMGTTITMTTFDPDVEPGDTIIIAASRTSPIKFNNIIGTSGSWITITNPSDAKVTITGDDGESTLHGGMGFSDCRYIRILGNSYASETYGIRLTGGYRGMRFWDCSDYEIGYLEIDSTTTGAGIVDNAYTDHTTSTVKENVLIHNNYIHDITTEGMYLGKSDTGLAPKYRDIQVYNNIISGRLALQ